MDKVCKSASRSKMCPLVRAHVDKQLEALALLHTSFGTRGKGDTETKSKLREAENEYYREIKRVAPNYYKRIILDK
jgi:hypothetical protein